MPGLILTEVQKSNRHLIRPVIIAHLENDAGKHASFGLQSDGQIRNITSSTKDDNLTTPRKNRAAKIPALLVAAAWQQRAIPHVTIILDCHTDGLILFSSRFDGASKTIYGIY